MKMLLFFLFQKTYDNVYCPFCNIFFFILKVEKEGFFFGRYTFELERIGDIKLDKFLFSLCI